MSKLAGVEMTVTRLPDGTRTLSIIFDNKVAAVSKPLNEEKAEDLANALAFTIQELTRDWEK